ncbi:MAG: hypothetical protein WAO20_16170 [Acidobacteriota bacterium]
MTKIASPGCSPAWHFYVGDMRTPKVTFDFLEVARGKVGFKPRVVGTPVWIDNISARSIEAFSYPGPPRPLGVHYAPESMVTDWQVLGPLTRTYPEIEKNGRSSDRVLRDAGVDRRWQPLATDPRGAVVTGRITEFLGSRTVAYFAATIEVPRGEKAELQLSSIDDLAVWLNGTFDGYWGRDRFAWYDVGTNPEHRPTGTLPLATGTNRLLIRVRGGQYATGGFFARLVRTPDVSYW